MHLIAGPVQPHVSENSRHVAPLHRPAMEHVHKEIAHLSEQAHSTAAHHFDLWLSHTPAKSVLDFNELSGLSLHQGLSLSELMLFMLPSHYRSPKEMFY